MTNIYMLIDLPTTHERLVVSLCHKTGASMASQPLDGPMASLMMACPEAMAGIDCRYAFGLDGIGKRDILSQW